MEKIKFTRNEILSIMKTTADLYNGRTIAKPRWDHTIELLDRAPYMSFKRLCELTLQACYTIEGQEPYDYLLNRFNKNDKMSKIVRSL